MFSGTRTSLSKGPRISLSRLLRAVLTNSNEKKYPIPQRNFLGFTNLWCASLPREVYEFNKPLTSRRLPRFQSHSGASGSCERYAANNGFTFLILRRPGCRKTVIYLLLREI